MMSSFSVYAAGKNANGQFGLGHNDTVNTLTLNPTKFNITNIYCGDGFNIYANFKSQIFLFAGRNECGQGGVGANTKTKVLTPITYFKQNNITITNIFTDACGWNTFWITNTGKLYGNGHNKDKTLGIGDQTHRFIPSLINNINNVVNIHTASYYSIALTGINKTSNTIVKYWFKYNNIYNMQIPNDIFNLIIVFYGVNYKVYSTESSRYGGDGHGKNNRDNSGLWKEIEFLKNKNIIKICCGKVHSLFLSSSGSIYSCGDNGHGQLGLGKAFYENEIMVPTEIEYFQNNNIYIINISSGWQHNLAIDDDGVLYSWGKNVYGQCGVGHINALHLPERVTCLNNYKIIDIGCGSDHSYALTSDGKYFLFGDNQKGQCLVENNDNHDTNITNIKISDHDKILVPTLINKIVQDQTKCKIKDVFLGNDDTHVIVTTTQNTKQYV